MLNAVGAQLLMPIARGGLDNLWKILEPFDDALPALVAADLGPGHALCEKRRIFLRPEGMRPASWLSLDIVRLSSDSLQACFFDITQTVETEAREREALQVQAQKEGKIEIITNVLHDIGNAVTGLGTRAARLVAEESWPEILRSRQLGDFVRGEQAALAPALGEAKAGAMLAFVTALAGAIERRHREARDNADFFARTVAHVQEILNAQRRIVSHGQGSRPVPIAVVGLLADAVSIQGESLLKRQILARVTAPPGLPNMRGDRTRLLQLLVNLVKNAAEALDTQPPDKAREIAVGAHVAEGEGVRTMEITVADNGPGFAPEDAEEFFRRGRTGKAQGSGFGLSHARSIAEAHGGSLVLRSSGPGTGCTATLAIPITDP